MKSACCGHHHGRFEGFSRGYSRHFWALIALAAGFWLLLAMDMLRRAGAGWEREWRAEGHICAKRLRL